MILKLFFNNRCIILLEEPLHLWTQRCCSGLQNPQISIKLCIWRCAEPTSSIHGSSTLQLKGLANVLVVSLMSFSPQGNWCLKITYKQLKATMSYKVDNRWYLLQLIFKVIVFSNSEKRFHLRLCISVQHEIFNNPTLVDFNLY